MKWSPNKLLRVQFSYKLTNRLIWSSDVFQRKTQRIFLKSQFITTWPNQGKITTAGRFLKKEQKDKTREGRNVKTYQYPVGNKAFKFPSIKLMKKGLELVPFKSRGIIINSHCVVKGQTENKPGTQNPRKQPLSKNYPRRFSLEKCQ